jgi:thymidylate synthase (FAD)
MQIKTTYIGHMGSDLSVANAARVSFGKTSEMDTSDPFGPPKLKEKDAKLIRYLADHSHISPFGHCFISVHVKSPVFVARQLVKHKFLRWNEISRRYVDGEPEFYVPDEWRGRSADKKQGSEGVVRYEGPLGIYNQIDVYSELLRMGVCPEQARMVLPQSMMTEWYWSGSLDAFADMCRLRLKSDTQQETREVAMQVYDIIQPLFPVSWDALMAQGE